MYSTKDNLEVLFEDNHLLIVNKKSGDIVQADRTGDKPLSEVVKEYIKEKYNKPGEVFLGVVHRLDRPTSGLIIFARTTKALERLNKMLRDRLISKTYWAIIKNNPKKVKDTLVHFLKKNYKNNKSTVFIKKTEGSKKAVLHYFVSKKLDNYSLLEIDLDTGRHHQIRAQLSFIGSPIKGDLKYGASRSNKDNSIHLHARKICFVHPVSKENISLLAPTPDEVIWNACK